MVSDFLTVASFTVLMLTKLLLNSCSFTGLLKIISKMLWMLMSTAFLLNFIILSGDKGEDLLSKGDHDTTGDGEHAIGPLGGVMALEGQAQLEDTEAQQDQADGSN